MTAFGYYEGGAFLIPKYRVLLDYKPGAILVADVNQFHGNLPLLKGSVRIGAVFYSAEPLFRCGSAQ